MAKTDAEGLKLWLMSSSGSAGQGDEEVAPGRCTPFSSCHIETGPDPCGLKVRIIGVVPTGRGCRGPKSTVNRKMHTTGSTPIGMRKNAGACMARPCLEPWNQIRMVPRAHAVGAQGHFEVYPEIRAMSFRASDLLPFDFPGRL